MFQHGTSRENDPQLHTHCLIFNAARTHDDGKWRAMHQYPVYSWAKAAGAVYRNALAWNLRERLGIRIEQYGPDGAFTRIEGHAGGPAGLLVEAAQDDRGEGRGAGHPDARQRVPHGGRQQAHQGRKIPRQRSRDSSTAAGGTRPRGFVEREELIASVTGNKVEIGREAVRELTDRLDDLPAHLAREEAVFRRPDMVEAAANAAAGLIGPEALKTAIERLRRNPEIERLEPKKPTAESRAGMVHTEVYSTRHNLGLEQAVKDMTQSMAADAGHGLPEEAGGVEGRDAAGPELSAQPGAVSGDPARHRDGRPRGGDRGRGGLGQDHHATAHHRSSQGARLQDRADGGRLGGTAVALGDDCDARPYCVDKLLKLAAKGQLEIGRNTLIVVDEAGMLSTRQAHHILQLSERHGAKVVFAGDTPASSSPWRRGRG